jgi:hypothetical protein
MGKPSLGGGHLGLADQAITEMQDALGALRAQMAQDRCEPWDAALEMAALLETARSAHKASQDLCLHLAAEALNRGIGIATLGWQDPYRDE